jgi:mono/diheme cytochrome c family protein
MGFNFSLTKNHSLKATLTLFFAIASVSFSKAQDLKAGESLYKANCTSCHAIDRKVIGPALKDVIEAEDEAWMIKWIKNSQSLVKAGDPAAVKIFNEYNQSIMSSFPQFSDDDTKNIIAYVKAERDKPKAAPTDAAGAATGANASAVNDYTIIGLVILIAVLILVVYVLNRVINSLEKLIRINNGEVVDAIVNVIKEKVSTFKWVLLNKKKVFYVGMLFLFIFGGWAWDQMYNINVNTGYQPVQPIAFSHELHAGINQVNCQYCHSGAFKSKNASIPSLNVCMNCHNYVQATEKYNGEISPEIKKIYTALDYNPDTRTYGKNTKPIEWVRIHNLPDFSYFNHSQHVKVAGLACQQCHGPVEKMTEVYQYSPLTMGWCINCHRTTEVNSKGNAYYDKILAAHEEIKKGKKVTAALLGGLECVKCHY